jgi:glyoxylase-like metal-dependent hydrolase (beta-lactamase superfamily II)
MIFEQIRVGGDRNFAYLAGDEETRAGIVVDPAHSPQLVLERAAAHRLTIAYLINTHGHPDHAGGNATILAHTGAKLLRAGSPGASDSARLTMGRLTLTFIHTPGHTPDSLCLLVEEPGAPGKLITGDTLFVGKVGGTGFGEDARAEYHSLQQKLMSLPDETEVWPGHDYGVAPSSTIGHERRTNPFLLRESFETFVELKVNWVEYKRRHGIQ